MLNSIWPCSRNGGVPQSFSPPSACAQSGRTPQWLQSEPHRTPQTQAPPIPNTPFFPPHLLLPLPPTQVLQPTERQRIPAAPGTAGEGQGRHWGMERGTRRPQRQLSPLPVPLPTRAPSGGAASPGWEGVGSGWANVSPPQNWHLKHFAESVWGFQENRVCLFARKITVVIYTDT